MISEAPVPQDDTEKKPRAVDPINQAARKLATAKRDLGKAKGRVSKYSILFEKAKQESVALEAAYAAARADFDKLT